MQTNFPASGETHSGDFQRQMKTTIKQITPQWAAQILETRNPHNRSLSENFIQKLERDIKAKAWILTHQGIAFDENGDLIDGQHRLEAIRRSGCSVEMMVTTDVPASQRANGIMLKTFECIDSGRSRTVGQMLALNGYTQANAVAAVSRAMLNLAARKDSWLQVTTPQTEKVLAKCGTSIDAVIHSTAAKLAKATAPLRAVFAFYHTFDADRAIEFATAFSTLENISRNHPAYALATWSKNHSTNTAGAYHSTRVAGSAVFHFHHGNKAEKLYGSDEHIAWLLNQNAQLAKYLAAIINSVA